MSATSHQEKVPSDEEGQGPASPEAKDTSSADEIFSDNDKYGPAPDGGLRAWLVAVGGACTTFACLGFTNSFGVFQEYYMTHQFAGESPDKIAWIGSLSIFIQFAGGAVAGPLFDRYGAWVIRPAAIAYVLSVMLTSLCYEYWHFMLCQGVFMGICMSVLQFPAFAAVTQYFEKKRAAALGIVLAGSSIGGIIFPIALSKMLNSSNLGFGWSVRIMGFLITPLMLFACVAITARLPPRQTSFLLPSAFKDTRYNLLVTALFFSFLGMMTPLFFLPAYAVTRGIDPTLASYLLAILNGASTFGRVIPGILADKYGKINVFALGSLGTGIVVLCMNAATSIAGLVVYSIAIGFASGTIISGATAAFTACTDNPRNLGTYMGMGIAVGSIAALIGPPVNGALVHRYAGFLELSLFSGVMCLFGGVMAFASKGATTQGLWGRT